MAHEITATDDRIIEAGHELGLQGKKVTGSLLRRITGSGDPTRLVAVWKIHEAANRQPLVPEPLPGTIEAALVAERERLSAGLATVAYAIWKAAEDLTATRMASETGILRRDRTGTGHPSPDA